MKRINRKKLLDVLETARQGYSSIIIIASEIDDKVLELSCKAHHGMLNKQIVELGGESVEPPLMNI